MGSLRDSLQAHPAAQNAQIPAPGYPAVSAAFLVEASTREQAQQTADGILWDALTALVEALPSSHAGSWTCGAEVYPHRPGKPGASADHAG